MLELDYDKIQAKIVRPSHLCKHCGKCMPIIDGENLNSDDISNNATRGPVCIWDEYPEYCGFTGWLFQEREKQKHLIRKVKEELRVLLLLDEDILVAKDTTAKQQITKLLTQIKPWEKHGANNW